MLAKQGVHEPFFHARNNQIRCVFLLKAEVLEGTLAVDKMRPICIQPVLRGARCSCMAELCRECFLQFHLLSPSQLFGDGAWSLF